jgi:hypothetical protein
MVLNGGTILAFSYEYWGSNEKPQKGYLLSWPRLKPECYHVKSTAYFKQLMLLTCIAFQPRTNAEPTATKTQ